MRRARATVLAAALLVLTGFGAAASVAGAAAASRPTLSPRLAALAAGLREAPLAVDPDVAWLLPTADRRAVDLTLKGAQVPFHVALLPSLSEDESGGDGRRAAAALARAVGDPGVYLVIDADGGFDAVAVRAPRELGFRFEDHVVAPGYGSVPALRIPQRLAALVRQVDEAPPGRTSTGAEYLTPVRPVHYRADRTPSVASDLAVAAILGALAGTIVGWPLRLVARRRKKAAHGR